LKFFGTRKSDFSSIEAKIIVDEVLIVRSLVPQTYSNDIGSPHINIMLLLLMHQHSSYASIAILWFPMFVLLEGDDSIMMRFCGCYE
jgi:hypothetical protein